MHGDREFFIPATTLQEAINRVFSLTGAEQRNRGEKRALVALRDALGLDVDVTKTNAVTAERIAGALDVEWRPVEFTVKNKVNLAGLNALLEGATDAYYEGQLVRLKGSTPSDAHRPRLGRVPAGGLQDRGRYANRTAHWSTAGTLGAGEQGAQVRAREPC